MIEMPKTRVVSKDRHESLVTRFWNRVRKTETCWLWTDRTTFFGYGVIIHEKRLYRSNRLSWELHFGTIPLGLFVLHHCDVTACVRPDHLYVGTQAQNIHDMWSRKRIHIVRRCGEKSPVAKLKESDIIEIRRRAATGETFVSISKTFPVGRKAIARAARGQQWSFVTEPVPDDSAFIRQLPPPATSSQRARGENVGTSKLTESQVIDIRKLFGNGYTRSVLAAKFSVSWPTINSIVSCNTWRHVTVDQD